MRILPALSLMFAASLCAGPLGQGERDYALSQLHATRKMFVDAIQGLSPEQWRFKPAPDRWSIAEIAEHIILSEDGLTGWAKQVMQSPSVPDRKPDRGGDEKFYRAWTDRTQRSQAPDALRPGSGRWPTPAAAIKEFEARRGRTLDYIRTTQDDLRSHITRTPEGELDAYQIYLGIAAHAERHVAQLNEVKAAPGFPSR